MKKGSVFIFSQYCLSQHATGILFLSVCNSRVLKLIINKNKNLAITNRSRVSCAHNNVEGIYDNPVTLKSRLRVSQDHWKRNHWTEHIRLTISRVIWHCILSWPWNVG